MRRMYEPNRSQREIARNLRETFVDRPATREQAVPWRWPTMMQEIGICKAVMYASDKWQARRGAKEDYKHVSEAPQWVLCRPGFLVHYDDPDEKIDVCGPNITLGPMPDSFAVLADILGVQLRLYEPKGRNRDQWALPRDTFNGYYQVNISRAKLGAGKFPDTGDTFLIVYSSAGVDLLIVGSHLSVEKDGITG